MFHEKFRLDRNTRLMHRGITSIEINPKHKLQMVLGTNGSGKSTMLKELSPLASNHKHYEGGGKYGTLTHRGSTYEYSSDFTTSKNIYTLKRDGEVIYSGHVASAYNEAVEEHLGITQEIHDICSGVKKFTAMDPPKRRALLTKLSPVDFSYPLAYYKRLTDTHLAVSGSIKRAVLRLQQEKDKLIDDNEADRIRIDIDRLKASKDAMLKEWSPLAKTVEDCLRDLNSVDTAVVSLSERYRNSIRVFANTQGFTSEEAIRQAIAASQGHLTFHERSSEQIYDKVQENEGKLAQARILASNDIDELDRRIWTLGNEIRSKEASLTIRGYEDPVAARKALENIYNELHLTISKMPVDEENLITLEALNLKEENKARILMDNRLLEKRVSHLNDVISSYEHRVKEGATTCPKCDHKWIPGVNESHYNLAKEELVVLSNTLSANNEMVSRLEATAALFREHLTVYKYFFMIVNSNLDVLRPLWDAIATDNFYKRKPTNAILTLQAAKEDLENEVAIFRLSQELKEAQALQELARKNSGLNLEALTAENAALSEQLHIHQKQAYFQKLEIQRHQTFLNEWLFQANAEIQFSALMEGRTEILSKAEEANKRILINELLSNIDLEISGKERLLSQIENQKAIVKAIEVDISDNQALEVLLKRSIDYLSPKEGLIAKGLTGFINHFNSQVNGIIEKVWLYPLAVKPVKITEENGVDLDYKFPFTVEGRDAGLNIADGSGAQTEIFDLAYMLLTMIHSGLEDYPVFLDEFSIKMDYAHRRAAMKLVTELLTTSNFSQVFMISHYESSYGSLDNADVTVLCAENIEIPMEIAVNTNASIERA